MKQLFCAAFLLVFFSCNDPVTILPLEVQGLEGKMTLVAPSGVLKFKPNQSVKWRSTGGTVTQGLNDTLTYTAPATVGVQQIIIKHPDNSADSLLLNIAVTPSAALFKSLQAGNHVIVFRHAAADVGSDQPQSTTPEWWKSCDAKLARQLNQQGMTDATKTGKTIKLLELPIGRVTSSEFCRCFTSAEQMATGLPVQRANELTLTVYDEPKRCDNMLKLAATQPRDGKNSLFVIHAGITVTQPDCTILNNLQWGDAAIFTLNADKTSSFAGKIPVKDWTDLTK